MCIRDRIEANEVKWYMASVDQYRGLWYGEGALNSVDPDARLFRAKTVSYTHLDVYKRQV